MDWLALITLLVVGALWWLEREAPTGPASGSSPGGPAAKPPAPTSPPRPTATRRRRPDEADEEAFWDGAVFGFYGARYWGRDREPAEPEPWAGDDGCDDVDSMWDDDLDF